MTTEHTCTCRIQWVDRIGTPTPDTNPAIGLCYREAYDYTSRDGHVMHFTETERFPICAEHKLRLDRTPHWIFEPFYGPSAE